MERKCPRIEKGMMRDGTAKPSRQSRATLRPGDAEDQAATDRDSGKGWPLPDRAAFGPWVAASFDASGSSDASASAAATPGGAIVLSVQQRFCRDYLAHAGPHRGLVLYHGLGSGKSCSAIATAEALRAAAGRDVYVLLPASLRSNYVREVRKCGARSFLEQQAWQAVTPPAGRQSSSSSSTSDAAWAAAVGEKTLRDTGGRLWIPRGDAVTPRASSSSGGPSRALGGPSRAGTPFAALSKTHQDQVRRQVDSAVASTHHFVHYNGLNVRSVAALCAGPTNRFDDAVVVVDEAHNFVSNMGLGTKLVDRLYRRILEARRCKVMLLSGTPLVNQPEELASLVNLAAGPIEVHDLELGPRGLLEDDRARLAASPHVRDFWEVEGAAAAAKGAASSFGRQVLRVRLVPEGFVRVSETSHRVVRDTGASSASRASRASSGVSSGAVEDRRILDVTASITGSLASSSSSSKSSSASNRRTLELLPSDPEAFRAAFVDEDSNDLRNVDVLTRRCLGAISYFRGHDPSVYPALRSLELVLLPLSARQFGEYTVLRAGERRKEEAARRFAAARSNRAAAAGGPDRSGSSVGLRPLSRPACTFVFPEGIVRPRIGDFRSSKVDPEDPEDPEVSTGADGSEAGKAYSEALDAAIQQLRDLPPSALAASASSKKLATSRQKTEETPGLALLSPKFDAIVSRLLETSRGPAASRGTALVYSTFRRAEGVDILAVALEANGFVRLDVVPSGVTKGIESHSEYVAVLKLGGKVVEDPSEEVRSRPRFIMYSNDDARASSELMALFNNLPGDASASVQRSAAALMPTSAGLKGDPKVVKGTQPQNQLGNLRGEQAAAMLITKSGAEGISLRNVREVHVIEPFWHANRITQVIGRARRAFSHVDLPPEERTIDVRVYLARFTPEQAKLHARDGGLTSDEHVHAVAQKKRKLLEQMLAVMRSAAVDCELFSGPAPKCFRSPEAAADPGLRLYDPELARDLERADAVNRKERRAKDAAAEAEARRRRRGSSGSMRRKLTTVRRGGVKYFLDSEAGILYDHAALRDRGQLLVVRKEDAVK